MKRKVDSLSSLSGEEDVQDDDPNTDILLEEFNQFIKNQQYQFLTDAHLKIALPTIQNIEHINFSGSQIKNISLLLLQLPHLITLRLAAVKNVPKQEFLNLIINAIDPSKLRQLDISLNAQINDDFLDKLAQNSKKFQDLEVIGLDMCMQITNNGINKLIGPNNKLLFPNIQRINISDTSINKEELQNEDVQNILINDDY